MKRKFIFAVVTITGNLSLMATSPEQTQASGSFISVIIDSGVVGIAIWLMLFACSIVTLWLLIDSVIRIQRNKICPPQLLGDCRTLLDAGDVATIIAVCQNNDSPLAGIFVHMFQKISLGYNAAEEAAGKALRDTEEKLMQKTAYLNMLGAIAPMLGLLGTVTGMVTAFFSLGSASGVEKAQMLAMAISQALYTTAAGLFISIPAIVAYSILKNKIRSNIALMEEIVSDILLEIKGRLS